MPNMFEPSLCIARALRKTPRQDLNRRDKIDVCNFTIMLFLRKTQRSHPTALVQNYLRCTYSKYDVYYKLEEVTLSTSPTVRKKDTGNVRLRSACIVTLLLTKSFIE